MNATATPNQAPITQRVVAIVLEDLGCPHYLWSLETRLVEDLGADSLDYVEISLHLLNEFQIKGEISLEQMNQWGTIADILRYVERTTNLVPNPGSTGCHPVGSESLSEQALPQSTSAETLPTSGQTARAPQHNEPQTWPRRPGMRQSLAGVLLRLVPAMREAGDPLGYADVLETLGGHIAEMSQRFYEGDIEAVDEFLQLYDVDETREN